jgi:hypothetical protein
MSRKGKYIYGVVRDAHHAAGTKPAALNGVYTVPYKAVSAAVSDSEIIDYENLPGHIAARRLFEHQAVMERLMEEFTVIPARLGTYVYGEEEVTQVLTAGYRMFQDIFEKIEGRIELDVMASWVDLRAVVQALSEEGEVKAVRQALLDKKDGITVDDRIEAGMLVKNCLDKKKTECAGAVKKSLENLCRDIKEHGTPDDATIMNAAFFLDKERRVFFEERLEELSDSFGGEVRFKCVGPLPPYNFYVLEIKRLRYDEIQQARKKFALGDFATKKDIKAAYRKYASMHHPDKLPGPQHAQAGAEYVAIADAYSLLSTYCRYDSCSFKAEDFAKNSIVVAAKAP